MGIDKILDKVVGDEKLSKDEIVQLLKVKNPERKEEIFKLAQELTLKYLGSAIHLRGLIEFSNYCSRNCNYCGLRTENEGLERYRMNPEEIINQSEKIAEMGLNTVVLQSGEDRWYTTKDIEKIVREIKERTGLAITLSIGERDRDELEVWRQAGADRYLLKHETCNREIFKEIKPDSDYDHRFEIIENLIELDYQVGSGGMTGLPGQTEEDLAEDILYIRDNRIGMAGFGPFIPHQRTPYRNLAQGDAEFTLLLLAVARLVLKKVHLPATTALETLLEDGREKAIRAGANVIMPNITPLKYRKLYQIYPDKAQTNLKQVMKVIRELDRIIGQGKVDTII